MKFFGADRDELTMCFDFIGMQRMYLSLARGNAESLAEALRQRPQPPKDGHWATFVRNHDELTLDKLTDTQRQEVFQAFGPDPDMQLYGRGLRRRLPTMLGGDRDRIRMVYSLLFSLPGTPVLFYGEEIGMSENPDIAGRMSVRTPMQWSDDRNGGFSTAPPSRLAAVPPEGGASPTHVNASDQLNDQESLLHFIRRLAARYRISPEIGWGQIEILEHDSPAVLAHSVRADVGRMVALHNFSEEPARVLLTLADEPEGTWLSDLFGPGGRALDERGQVEFDLPGYGWTWARVARPGDGRIG
jgi:glycosidase